MTFKNIWRKNSLSKEILGENRKNHKYGADYSSSLQKQKELSPYNCATDAHFHLQQNHNLTKNLQRLLSRHPPPFRKDRQPTNSPIVGEHCELMSYYYTSYHRLNRILCRNPSCHLSLS